MLSTRKAIAIMLAVFAASMLASVYNLTQPPDSGGSGNDSYGTRGHGYRGLYETLDELGVSVKRAFVPPPHSLGKDETLVLMGPRHDLVRQEPEYFKQTKKWIEDGGHAVVALREKSEDTSRSRRSIFSDDDETSALKQLGVPDLQLVEIDVAKDSAFAAQDEAAEDSRRRREHVTGFHVADERDTGVTTVSLMPGFESLRADVRRLRLPIEDLQVFERTTATSKLFGEISLASDDNVNYTLVAVVPTGKGTLTVVSDSALFYNHLFPAVDNSVLAVNLLAGSGRTLVFDEFYHGLNVRGNPLWLLTQPHYGMVLIAVLLGLGLWIWREATVLGPPLQETVVSRRSLGEYLEAMATLFLRARHRKFLLRELRTGVLWALRQRLHLPPGQENLGAIVTALERHEPEKARRLEAVSRMIDGMAEDKRTVPEEKFIEAAREITRCL